MIVFIYLYMNAKMIFDFGKIGICLLLDEFIGINMQDNTHAHVISPNDIKSFEHSRSQSRFW